MRPFFFTTCLIVAASLLCAAPLDARGGKGGGGGRSRASSGGGHHGGGGGGPKWSGQQSHSGGGQRLAEHGQKPTSGGGKHQFADKQHQPGKDKEKEKDKKEKEKEKEKDKYVRSTPTNDATGDFADAYNKKQKQLDIEQRNRDKRLAQAEHLRAIGERNGNQNLLDNADRMEAFAHDHYARRVSQLEKFGVTDPTLNPGSDPLWPGTDGFVDPLGDLGALDLFPLRP